MPVYLNDIPKCSKIIRMGLMTLTVVLNPVLNGLYLERTTV